MLLPHESNQQMIHFLVLSTVGWNFLNVLAVENVGRTAVFYQPPESAFLTTAMRATYDGWLFAEFSTTTEATAELPLFAPFQSAYNVAGGVNLGPLEVKYFHECLHPADSYQTDRPKLFGGTDRVSVTLKLEATWP
jgi:hypothetical protein